MKENDNSAANQTCAFDEFRLYFESTERVTDRRLNTNRWNYSISVAILLAIAGIYSWAIGNRDYFITAGLTILLLSMLAGTFCLFWLRQVEDWKSLNNAKFSVLSDMAKRLQIESPSGASTTKSYRPFDREWELLQKSEAVSTVRTKLGKLEALNASGAELFMPRAFLALFSLIFLGTLLTILISWSSMPHRIAPPSESSQPAAENHSSQ
jgi:hypothetical protein